MIPISSARSCREYGHLHWLIALGLVTLCLAATLMLAVNLNMPRSVEDPDDEYMYDWYRTMYSHNISIALSSLGHDLDGYLGYRRVLDIIKSGNVSNEAIKKALALEDIEADRTYNQTLMDLGFADFARIAFAIFGYRTESLFNLYCLLFLLLVGCYFIQFRNDKTALALLLVFLLAHYVGVAATSFVGANLDAVHNFRFMAVLAVLPVFHISLLVLRKKELTWPSGCAVVFQACMIVFAIWIRSSTLWTVVFFLGFGVVVIAGEWFVRAPAGAGVEKMHQIFRRARCLWPVGIYLGIEIAFAVTKPFILDESYFDKESGNHGHTKWEAVYQGLSIHPVIGNTYSSAEVDIDGWISLVCRDADDEPQPFIRQWLCDNRDVIPLFRWASIAITRAASDQETYNAMFKWLLDHGESEMAAFTFGSHERVSYRRSILWFQRHSPSRHHIGPDSANGPHKARAFRPPSPINAR